MTHDPHQEPGTASPLARALRSRRRTRPSRGALIGSLLVHLALAGTAFASTRIIPPPEPMMQFKTYRVQLYSPPPQVEGEPEPPKEVARPAIVQPPPRAPQPKPKPETKPAPRPAPPKTEQTSTPAKPATPEPVRGRNARPGPVGGENLNVLQEGEIFPYPGYLENVITQINRYFRWTGSSNLETEVGFYIRRDGSVSGLRVFTRSANFNFDMAAMEAVERAGRARTFGSLPEEFPRDSLGVLFRFLPPNR